MKKLALLLTFVLILNIVPGAAVASKTEYALTSSMNEGWASDIPEMTPLAYANLGTTPEFSNMTAQIGDDAESLEVSRIMGKEGWVLTPNKGTKARYINIDINDDFIYDVEDGQSYMVEVEYFDEGISSLSMTCDSMDYYTSVYVDPSGELSQPALNKTSNTYEGEYLVFKDSGVWRKYRWFLPNPKFTNQLEGFDIRVGIYSESMLYSRGGEVNISSVKLYKLDTKSIIDIKSDTSEHIGNIFFTGETVQLKTSFAATLYPYYTNFNKQYDIDVVYTVKNEDGDEVYRTTDSFVIKKDEEVLRTVEIPTDKYGIYRYDVEAYCTDKKLYSFYGGEFSYVYSKKGEVLNNKVGVSIGLVNNEDDRIAKLARNAGIPHVRMMLYYYNFIKSLERYEPTNVAIPEGFKSLFRAFKNAGLTIDANLHSASWMGAAYNFSPIERTPPYTEQGLRRWGEYCAMMAELFGDTVDYFEVWNEYNLGPNHSFNRENRPAEDYGKMYEVSKKAIKSVNPKIPVIGLNTSGVPDAWIESVLASGVTDMDILSIHPYRWYGDPLTYPISPSIERISKLFEKYNMQDIPLWITELGYSSHYEDVNTDLEQGMYNVQAYATIMATEKVDRYYFYCFLDKHTNIRADRESNFGMLRARINYPMPYMQAYAAKPGYLAVSFLNHMYSDAEFVGKTELGTNSMIIRNRHKNTDKQFAVMFSNKDDGEQVTLNLGTDEITLYDAYGNAQTLHGHNGIYSFDLSKRVTYIEGDFKSFERVTGGVYPETVSLTANYGETAKLPIANFSGKTVNVKATPLCGSEAEESECVIEGERGILEIKGGNAVSGVERVKLLICDNEKTYFNGFVYINYKPLVEAATTLVPMPDGWIMRCMLTNLSETAAASGRLTVLTPQEWKSQIPDTYVTLNAKEEKSIDIRLPLAEVADERTIEIGFVTDESTQMGSYVSRNYNFSAALYADEKITIDGKADEWKSGFMNLNRNDQFISLLSLGNPYAGPDDLSAKIAIKWDEENFYLFADVLDNVHFSTGVKPVNIWQMDSIQLALVYDPADELGKQEFEEIAIGEIDGEPTIYRHKTCFKGDDDYTKVEGSELAVVTEGMHTYYELKVPWDSLMVSKVNIEPGTELKFAMVVNENDGVGRVGYMAFGDGIVSSKNSTLFKRLYIRK